MLKELGVYETDIFTTCMTGRSGTKMPKEDRRLTEKLTFVSLLKDIEEGVK